MLYQMVLADGIVDVEELKTLNRIGAEKYGITSEQINQIIRNTDALLNYPDSLEDKVSILYQLAEIALADGKLDVAERSLMNKYIVAMGFDENNVDAISKFLFDSVRNNMTEQEVLNQILND